jgi:ubiquinol-cytochrome c reductase subunit 8
MGWWGNLGSPTQKNVITYSMSANRLNPMSGIIHSAIFNTFRRTRNQFLYWVPPLLIAYLTMDWAVERYVFTLGLGTGTAGQAIGC